jgi:hypothetical protein
VYYAKKCTICNIVTIAFPYVSQFAKLRKATITFIMSVPAVRPAAWNSAAGERNSMTLEVDGGKCLLKPVTKMKVSLKIRQNNVKTYVHLRLIWLQMLPELPSIVTGNNK